MNNSGIKMDGCIRELSKRCCFDSDLIYAIYAAEQEFIEDIVKCVRSNFNKMLNICKRYGSEYKALCILFADDLCGFKVERS
jgi:hypothetical protein